MLCLASHCYCSNHEGVDKVLGKKAVLILLALCSLLFAALFYTKDPLDIKNAGELELFIPGLTKRLADIKRILINTNDGVVELVYRDGQFLVKSKENYPADVKAVRQLLYGVAELEILEVKTSNELLLGEIGLANDEASVRVRFNDGRDNSIADILFGKSQAGLSKQGRDWFIRQYKSPQAWLVNGDINLFKQPIQWVDKNILALESGSLKQIELYPETSDAVKITKTEQSSMFTIANLKETEKVEPQKVEQLVDSFRDLRFDDVRPRNEQVLSKDIQAINIETTAGLFIFILVTDAEQGWIVLQAIAASADEVVNNEAESYNQLWADWEYKLPKFKIDQLLNKKQDLLTEEEPS